MSRADIATYIALALMAPFLLWGLHLLRVRFFRDQEVPGEIEAATLAFLIVFYAFQFALMERLLAESIPQLFAACFFLVAIGAVLYGPMMASLASRAMVQVFMPTAEASIPTPHFGPAERFERLDDYEGALHEYTSVARLFPAHPDVALRVGSTLARLGRHDEAVLQLRKALDANRDPGEAYPLLVRLVEILDHSLGKRDEAIAALGAFAAANAGTEEASHAQRRAERLVQAPAPLPRGIAPSAEAGDMPGSLLPGMAAMSAEVAGGDADDESIHLPEELPSLGISPATEEEDAPDDGEDTELPGSSLPHR